jgi:hypothetical protein
MIEGLKEEMIEWEEVSGGLLVLCQVNSKAETKN